MKVQGLNSSSKKTRKLIKRVFAELMNEKKELRKITVTELVKRAEITRSTFYTHYDDIYDVAEDYQLETIELFINDNNKITYNKEDIFNYFDDVFTCLKKNEAIYRMLLASNETLFFLEKLRKLSNQKLYCAIKDTKENNKYLELDICFFVDGLISQIIKYYREQCDFTLDDLLVNTKKWFEEIFV